MAGDLPAGFRLDAAPPAGFTLDPPPPAGFKVDKPRLRPVDGMMGSGGILRSAGSAHDGDTLALTGGGNARLSGVDAFELNQTVVGSSGQIMPLGRDAQRYLSGQIGPDSILTDTGKRSYDRPVAILSNGAQDVNRSIIDQGMGLAAPAYLRGDPRLSAYMEAERLARLNRRGAHAGRFQDPADFRARKPWADAELATDGKGVAVFNDEPTPFQGLRPDIADGYLALSNSPTSTAADLVSFGEANGFVIDPAKAEKFVRARNAGAKVSQSITYEDLPKVLTDSGDGGFGAGLRGFADPVNLLDELGGVVDTVGGTAGRESVWNSDRRVGDILWNNIDQNRGILDYDDAFHPYARFGGQLASGLILPGASIEGVGLGAARTAMRAGGSRIAAEAAAKAAVRSRLALAGGAEGAVAGFGAGEGGVVDRLPSAAVGAGIGAGAGVLLSEVAPYALNAWRNVRRPRAAEAPTPQAATQPPSGYVPDGPSMPMANEIAPDVITGRLIDRLDMPAVEPPPGFVLDDLPVGRVPRLDQPAAADVANVARAVNPEDVTPLPDSAIRSLDEAVTANPGPLSPVLAPDERQALPSYRLAGKGPLRRDPIDLLGWLRTKGGLQDYRGELAHAGIDNRPRDIEFARSEGFLGRAVNPEGMSVDDAALRAWEAGYFPDHDTPPSIPEFLDALRETHRGGPARVFHPDDFDVIDAYRSAQGQRFAVENAAQEGAPLVEDIGRPVTLDDLDANQPPATAYEDLPAIGGKVGNIRVDKLESSEDIARALQTVDDRFGGFDAARRGRVSQAETEALAREMGMTADDLLKRRRGQALNAEQALAARSILAKSGDELVRLAERARGGSEEDLTRFRTALIRHAAIQEQVAGATAEAGRALAQFRMNASAKLPRGTVLRQLVENAGGRDKIEDAAEAILDLQRETGDPAAVAKFARDAAKPRFRDKLVELYYNSLLSGPQTHAVNILSNAITSGLQLPEHVAASAIGAGRRMLPNANADRVMLSEVGERAVGMMQGAREGLRAFARTARTGIVPDHVTKVEAQEQEAISGLKGKVLRTPTRLLSAEDEFFKAIARRMELNGLAVRKARMEGLTGDALRRRIEDLTANPPDEMFEQALDYARYLTFQKPLGKFGNLVTAATNEMPILKLIVPFIRTPTNIMKFAIERSPVAPVLRTVRDDIRAGGAKRDLALARVALGTGLGMLASQWAEDGTITGGGPADKGARSLLLADGWQPYSVRIGDTYYSYQRLDPMATTLGVAADLIETGQYMTDEQRERAALVVTGAIIKNLSNKVWLSGISNLSQAIEDPDRYAGGFISQLVGGMAMPAISSQVARTVDPVLREARNPLDRIQSRIPFASRSLVPKRDVFGQVIESEGGVGPDLISPMRTSTARNDPTIAHMLGMGATFGRVPRKVGGRELTDGQYDQFQAMAGQNLRQELDAAVLSSWWTTANEEEKERLIEKAKREARSAARASLFPDRR